MIDTKPTNPKDAIGSKKLALHLVPSIVSTYAALGFTEGALKYGKYNWRVAGVRMSIYLDAIYRHLAKLQNGEWADKETRVPHIASIIACSGIIADAYASGKLTDDRPPAQELLPDWIDNQGREITAHLQELFKDYSPHQHTILDEPEVVKSDARRKGKKRGRPSLKGRKRVQA